MASPRSTGIALLACLTLPGAARSQEAVVAEAGGAATVALRVPEEVLGPESREGGHARFKAVASDGVQLLGEARGTLDWRSGEEPLLPLTLVLPPRLPAGRYQAALVIFTGPTGLRAAAAAEVWIALTRRVRVQLDTTRLTLRPGARAQLSYRLENLGNGEDALDIQVEASDGLRVTGVAAGLVLPPFGHHVGKLSVEASPAIRPGAEAFVRLAVPDRGHLATATARLAISGEAGYLPGLVHLPATVYFGSSVTAGSGSSVDPVAGIEAGGQVARGTDVWFSFRHLPGVGSPVFRGYEYGPRLQLGVRHRGFELSLGDLAMPTSSLAGYYLQGLGGGLRWLVDGFDLGGYLARPTNPDGSTDGHLVLAQGYHAGRYGSFGLLYSDVEGRLTVRGATTRQQAGLARYRLEAGGAHWGYADAGWVRAQREGSEPVSGPALDAGYLLRTRNTSAELRARVLPEGAQVAGLPAGQLRLGGSQRLLGPIHATALVFDERASLQERLAGQPGEDPSGVGPDPFDPSSAPPIVRPAFAHQRVQGAEGGFRYLDRGVRVDLVATARRVESELEGVEPSTRRTLRAGAGLPIGALRFDAVAEVGESAAGASSELAQRYQGTLYWYGSTAWLRFGFLFIDDLLVPRTALSDAGGALRLSDRVEFYGSATVDWERSGFDEGLSGRVGAQIGLLPATDLFLGAESLPIVGNESRWRFTVGFRRVLSLPLPVRRSPAVSGVVFEDRNGNGTREAGERPLAGVRVVFGWDRAVSDAEGRFTFRQNMTRAELRVDPTGLQADMLPPAPMPVPPDGYVEIPVARSAYLRAVAYLDANGDGERGPDEPGLGGLTLLLEGDDGTLWEASSDEEGVVVFAAMQPGRYVVTVDESSLPPGTAAPAPIEIELLGGGSLAVEIAVPAPSRRIRYSGARDRAETEGSPDSQ